MGPIVNIFSPHTGEADGRNHNFVAVDTGFAASFVHRFAYVRCRGRNAYAEWVRRACLAFANHALFAVHNYGARARTATIHSGHQQCRMRPAAD
jgi:hypothetical protein